MTTSGADFEANVCAACGKAEVDNVKLKKCSACKSVRYCGVACQQNHRPQHKRDCKKRAADLRHQILFRQPESSHLGDCPICFLPLPLEDHKSVISTCCSKIICDGCVYASITLSLEELIERTCPFCRQPTPRTDAQHDSNEKRRCEANDPVAIHQMGAKCYHKGDYVTAFEYYTRAARLGDLEAHYRLANLYIEGKGVEKDMKKAVFHNEEAAIGGHPIARHNLGCEDWRKGRAGRAVKHWNIAANLGYGESIEMLKKLYVKGSVSKEDFAAALRAHQAAVDATKSPQREAAEEKLQKWRVDTFE